MFTLNKTTFSETGETIFYDYTAVGIAEKYFSKKELLFSGYDINVSAVPPSIANIPLLANVMPIAWFAGFDVFVDEIDADFYHALQNIRTEIQKHHPSIAAKSTQLTYGKLVENKIPAHKNAMLFSGGVDAFATYFRHYEEHPDLITIQGADIGLDDTKQWDEVQTFNENEPILAPSNKHYIRTNFQQFYTVEVDLMLPNLGWWGNIQHGLALICAVAPLAYINQYGKVYIASTRSIHMEFNPWGSMPETDEKITWGGVEVVHDGFELKRQDKVDAIVSAVGKLQKHTTLRVCYSELKIGLNCSRCEKCIRTIFGIMLAGGNPNHYGFTADESIYEGVKKAVGKGFKSRGTQFFWSEILEKAQSVKNIYVFSDAQKEQIKMQETLKAIEASCAQSLVVASASKKMKHVFINKYPKLFGFYLKIRRYLQ